MFDCEDFEQGITHPVPSYKGLEYCLELLGLYRSQQTNTNPKKKTLPLKLNLAWKPNSEIYAIFKYKIRVIFLGNLEIKKVQIWWENQKSCIETFRPITISEFNFCKIIKRI